MRKRPVTNVAASVRQRLLNLAREQNEDFGLVLTRYAIERLLYRLSRSPHANDFILKGAQLFSLWTEKPHRTTRDLDLLCQGSPELARLETVFRDLCEQQADPPDGLAFDAGSVRAETIREAAAYDGVRVLVGYEIAGARDRLQVDVGFGDVIVPMPEIVAIPALLDLPAPRMKAYPMEAVVAEKYEAMISLGMANSRMKDFYDIWLLSRQFEFSGERLCQAISATFSRRKTPLPTGVPVALSPEFAADPGKQTQWRAFVRRSRLTPEADLSDVVAALREFLMPPTSAIIAGKPLAMVWCSVMGWGPRREQER
ncbi:MAG: nucleotidyl transferase AbiEii/AbiGii toxin family protein [Armatimonadetes bacterium]|nr:nucleotidyl transferase AbiEii/AbiGii toxin family protein [Armatimonadota bacterium]